MSLKSRIKLLTIDLDDTLWPCMPTIIQAENISYQWLSRHLPRITERYNIESLRDKRKQLLQREPSLIHDLSAARRAHFRELADELDYDYDWIDEGFKVFHDARQRVTLYDDVLPVLEQLKRRFHLVALTNGNADIQKTGLGRVFNIQISAADVMAAKPAPAMFEKAMQHYALTPEQTLHVGDHAIHDIYGAHRVGISSVWVNRHADSWKETDFSADYEISDLTGLLDLLL
ncbi:MAG: HAD family hydrolase [Gammaproteobacteria bacterium]|nr:HAD family hydrolase [Gammaproteobacteria bacterium]MDH5734490.1 HAD family hydrolase [Gammaproteobacteria bacterium]